MKTIWPSSPFSDAEDAGARRLGFVGGRSHFLPISRFSSGRLAAFGPPGRAQRTGLTTSPSRRGRLASRARARRCGPASRPARDAPGALRVEDSPRGGRRWGVPRPPRHPAEAGHHVAAYRLEPVRFDLHAKALAERLYVGLCRNDEPALALVDERLGLDIVFVADLRRSLRAGLRASRGRLPPYSSTTDGNLPLLALELAAAVRRPA